MNKNLKKLLIKTKKSVFSQQLGNNISNTKGDGYDFVELREYEAGEDIRKIDWVISAKMQQPYVKVFHTQRELNIVIVPILSGSLHFGTSKLKSDIVTEVCATLGYSCVAQGDNYTSYFANENIKLNTKMSKKLLGVDKMVEGIDSYNLIGKTINYKNITDELYRKVKKRSIMFLIGDFFYIDSLDLRILSKKHEVIIIIVRDEFEEKPSKIGNINLTDPSTSKVFEGNLNSSTIKEYEKKVKINDYKLEEKLKKLNISFVKVHTSSNVLLNMMKLFKR